MNLSAYQPPLRRVLRLTRIVSTFCTGDIGNNCHLHNSTTQPNPEYSCNHEDHQCVVKSVNSGMDYNTKPHPPEKSCFDNLEFKQKELVCDSKQIMSSQSRQLKQSSRIPYAVNKFYSGNSILSSGLFLEHSCAFYHRSSASPMFSHRKVNSLFRSSPLGQQTSFQTSQLGIFSFSPTKCILEASPFSVQPYLRLIRFDKPIGSWLLYWPCTWSIALANEPGCWPDFKMLALFGAGTFFMRGAGCIINDMWDKDFDSRVARTRTRPLAAGEITYLQALACLAVNLSCALAILLQLNTYSIVLGAASLGLVITYPLFKRFTYWPQFILGFAFNYGALLGWAAVKGSVDWSVCLPFYFSCIMWTIVYDTIYAHQDKDDDMLIGIKSTALLFGDQTKPWLAMFTALMTGGMTYTGYLCDVTWPYYMIVGMTATSIAKQIYSVNLDNTNDCAKAFYGHFYLGGVIFAGIVLANLLRPKVDTTAEEEESVQEKVVGGQ